LSRILALFGWGGGGDPKHLPDLRADLYVKYLAVRVGVLRDVQLVTQQAADDRLDKVLLGQPSGNISVFIV